MSNSQTSWRHSHSPAERMPLPHRSSHITRITSAVSWSSGRSLTPAPVSSVLTWLGRNRGIFRNKYTVKIVNYRALQPTPDCRCPAHHHPVRRRSTLRWLIQAVTDRQGDRWRDRSPYMYSQQSIMEATNWQIIFCIKFWKKEALRKSIHYWTPMWTCRLGELLTSLSLQDLIFLFPFSLLRSLSPVHGTQSITRSISTAFYFFSRKIASVCLFVVVQSKQKWEGRRVVVAVTCVCMTHSCLSVCLDQCRQSGVVDGG